MRFHLETCETCRALVAEDFELIRALESLTSVSPTAGFADRVMARVAIGEPAAVPVLSFPRLTRRRLVAIGAVAAGVAASVAWSAANRPALDAMLGTAAGGAVDAGWTAFRALAAAVATQPWFDSVRPFWVEPTRLIGGTIAGLLIYGSGIFALRRLVTPSASPVSGASA
jgi:anti-sigma factor RsiW